MARGHLAVALSTLLVHPPVQGRKIVDAFADYVCDPFFVAAAPHIQATFYDRVRTATRQAVVRFAAKHALLQLDPDERMDAREHADRMAVALDAFAQRDRELVRSVMAEYRDRFALSDAEVHTDALNRLGGQDYFWNLVDDSLASLLGQRVEHRLPRLGARGRRKSPVAAVRFELARQRLPALEQRFHRMRVSSQMAIADAWPDPYFVPTVISALGQASDFRGAESVGLVARKHAPYLALDSLRAALSAWADNTQCREASAMPETALHLFHETDHLGQERIAVFRDFLDKVREFVDDPNEYYAYPALAAALEAAAGPEHR